MDLRIGDTAPDFSAQTTEGPIRFHDWIGEHWALLFSHPKDFTPVCTTELGEVARLKPEFDRRDTRVIGLSVDPLERHHAWCEDIRETQGTAPNYPIIADVDMQVARLYDMLPAGAPGNGAVPDTATVRSTYFIGPDKRVKAILAYPMSAGRNFDEILRLLDALQLNARHNLATPVNWRPGDDCIIPTSVSDEEAKNLFTKGWRTLKSYLRLTPQPD